MADLYPLDPEALNEFGLPRHGDGVGPTLRPDIIAERHRHDWDSPAAEPLALADAEAGQAGLSLSQQALAQDLAHRARTRALAPEAADFLDIAEHGQAGGDNELQGARMEHAQAQGGQALTEGA